jgi:DNA-binding transcriptional ArsR family regulator
LAPKKKKEAEGFGRALKRDMGREVDIARETPRVAGGNALFMNPTRRDIFSLLCARPCLHLSGIAREMGLSVPTVRWHLGKLAADNFVSVRTLSRKKIYFPAGLLEDEDIGMLALLNDAGSRDIYFHILDEPGLSQKDLTSKLGVRHQVVMWHAGRLEKGGLIEMVADGRYRRYYPTDRLNIREDAGRKRLKHFREELIRRLKRDGVDPEVVRTTAGGIHFRVTSGTKRRSFRVPTQPYRTVLGKTPSRGEEGGELPEAAGRKGGIHIPAHRSRRSGKGGGGD